MAFSVLGTLAARRGAKSVAEIPTFRSMMDLLSIILVEHGDGIEEVSFSPVVSYMRKWWANHPANTRAVVDSFLTGAIQGIVRAMFDRYVTNTTTQSPSTQPPTSSTQPPTSSTQPQWSSMPAPTSTEPPLVSKW